MFHGSIMAHVSPRIRTTDRRSHTARVESRGAGCLTSGGVVRALRIDALLCEVSYQQHGIICLA